MTPVAGEISDREHRGGDADRACRASGASSWNNAPPGRPGSRSMYSARNQNGGNQRSRGLCCSNSGRMLRRPAASGTGSMIRNAIDAICTHGDTRRNARAGQAVDQHALHARRMPARRRCRRTAPPTACAADQPRRRPAARARHPPLISGPSSIPRIVCVEHEQAEEQRSAPATFAKKIERPPSGSGVRMM